MATARKLWLVFGILIGLLVLSVLAVLTRMQSIEDNVRAQADVARPRIGVSRELELGVVSYALAIHAHRLSADPAAVQRAAEAAAKVIADRNEYQRLAVTDRQQALVRRFDVLWGQLAAQGALILERDGKISSANMGRFELERQRLAKFINDEVEADAIAAYNVRREATIHNIRDVVGFAPLVLLAGVVIALLTSTLVGRTVLKGERTIIEQAERLRTTLASIGDGVITTDNANRIVTMNSVAESLTGWEKGAAVGQPLDTVFRVVDALTREPAESPAARALREGAIVGLSSQCILVAKDGAQRSIDDTAAPIRTSSGDIVGCVLVFRDVTARREAERQVRDGERTQWMLAQIGVLGARTGADSGLAMDQLIKAIVEGVARELKVTRCGLSRVNLAAGQMIVEEDAHFGLGSLKGSHPITPYTAHMVADGMAGRPTIVTDLAADPRTAARYAERYEPLGVRAYISVPLHREGVWVASLWVSSSEPRHWGLGEVELLKAVADRLWLVVEQARSAEALRESDQRFRLIANSAPVLMWLNDTSGCTFVNRAYLDFLGLEVQTEVRGYDWAQFIHPEDREAYVASYLDCLARRARFTAEFRFRRSDGEYRWMQSVAEPRVTTTGEFLGYTGCTFDVHESRTTAMALQEADRRKDVFLTILAHELRNPLSPVRNAAHYLQRKDLADPELTRMVGMIDRQVAQMGRLIDDLLDVSRITRGRFELLLERCDFVEIAHAAIEACRNEIETRGHSLRVALPPAPVAVRADRHRLLQVFSNLLLNAAKYTPAGGEIEFIARADGRGLEVLIKDNGIGIPPDKLDEIFELFAQVDRSLERQSGLGVGLTLARQLIELHQGTVDARSLGLGHGSTFVVHMPVALAEPPKTEVGGERPLSSPARRILVADDNQDAAESLALILRAEGHEVKVAFDGEAAVELCSGFLPEVAFLDIGMPKLNGYEVARRLRLEDSGKSIRLVALTGWGQEDDRQRSAEAGFNAHFVKPVSSEALIRFIADLDPRREQSVVEA